MFVCVLGPLRVGVRGWRSCSTSRVKRKRPKAGFVLHVSKSADRHEDEGPQVRLRCAIIVTVAVVTFWL